MSIAVTCPSCGQQVAAPDAFAGRKVRCKGCGTSVLVSVREPVAQLEEDGPPPVPHADEDAYEEQEEDLEELEACAQRLKDRA